MKIVVYTAPNCPACKLVKGRFTTHGVPFSEVRLDEHPAEATRLRDAGFATAPVVEVRGEDGEVVDRWAGMRPDRLDGLITDMLRVS